MLAQGHKSTNHCPVFKESKYLDLASARVSKYGAESPDSRALSASGPDPTEGPVCWAGPGDLWGRLAPLMYAPEPARPGRTLYGWAGEAA
ncbi:unnamed protein product [Arctogadus glacialis]